MTCDDAREAISADLDGEASPLDVADVEGHLGGCPSCRSWREAAHAHTRLVRLRAAEPPWRPGPGLVGAVTRGAVHRRRRRTILLARAGLLSLAAAQVAIVVPAWLFGGHDVARDAGAFDLAMGAGFLLAAVRPDRSRGMVTIVGTAAALLLATAVVETASGRTGALSEAPHLVAVLGWALLYHLSTLTGPGPGETPPSWTGGSRFSFGAPASGRRRHAVAGRAGGPSLRASSVAATDPVAGPPPATDPARRPRRRAVA